MISLHDSTFLDSHCKVKATVRSLVRQSGKSQRSADRKMQFGMRLRSEASPTDASRMKPLLQIVPTGARPVKKYRDAWAGLESWLGAEIDVHVGTRLDDVLLKRQHVGKGTECCCNLCCMQGS